jgi:hypothetical protein|tara:strand:- start:1207 stop:1596 length:390 start_codon:yes stop_codon:yes gene_type:complete
MGIPRADSSNRKKQTRLRKRPYKQGDVVLVKSVAGDAIDPVHVKLVERVIVKPQKGNNFDWPGYSGWEAEIVFQEEADYMRKQWCINFDGPGDKTFVYDHCIIKKPKNPTPKVKKISSTKRLRKKSKRM